MLTKSARIFLNLMFFLVFILITYFIISCKPFLFFVFNSFSNWIKSAENKLQPFGFIIAHVLNY